MWNTCPECFSYMYKEKEKYKCAECGMELCQVDTPVVFNRKKELAKKYFKNIREILISKGA